MKIKYILMLFCVLFSQNALFGQVENLFTYSNGNINNKSKFISQFSVEVNSTKLPTNVKVYTYNEEIISNEYSLAFCGTSPSLNAGIDFIRIYDSSKRLLIDHAGYSPLENVHYLTMKNNDNSKYIKVPLDSETFALIFGGVTFDGDDDAPEMVIIVVHKNQAKVVFDNRALAYSYTPAPNFSIEFVDTLNWVEDSEGYVMDVTAEPLSSKTKHKIWKEGNMLKYKSWK